MNKTLKKQVIPLLIMSFSCFVIFYIVPIVMNIIYAFIDYVGEGQFVGFQNYNMLFYDELFREALGNTGIFLGIGIPIMLISGYVIGMLLGHLNEHLKWAKLPFLMSILLPTASVTYAWEILFGNGSFIGETLLGINMWQTQTRDIIPLLLLYIWKNVGYCILVFLVGWTTIPKEIHEAAQVDGANGWERQRYITFPLMIPSICVAFVLALVQGLKIGRESFILYGELPKTSLYMIQNYFRARFIQMDIGVMSSAAVILEGIIGIVLIICYYSLGIRNNRE